MPIPWNRELAQAASWDEANRSMRAGGRTSWNEDDTQVCWDTFNRLWPLCEHKIEPGECFFCTPDRPDAPRPLRLKKLPS